MTARYTIHATKKLRDRVKQPIEEPVAQPATMLGNWYATAWMWRPRLALFVNEKTLLPVVTELAPAKDLATRFPRALADVLTALEIDPRFIEAETANMTEASYAKTASRSIVGMLTEFTFLAEAHRAGGRPVHPVALSLRLAHTPCSPLSKSQSYPDRELAAFVEQLEW